MKREELKPVEPARRHVVNIHEAAFVPMPSDLGTSGESVVQLGEDRQLGSGFHVYRMAPGTWTTPHAHIGEEHFLVLEGGLVDHDGYEYGPGDLVCLDEGTVHCSHSPNGALLVVFYGTAELAHKVKKS